MATSSLGAWDYVIIAIVLIISASWGLYYRFTGGRQKTTKEFLLANRSMSVTPVAFSLMASFMSAVTLLGVSMENYQYGTMFVLINISYVVSTPIVAYLILPVFYRLKTASVYEYLEERFGYATRLCASLAFSLQMILYMGIVLFAPALALEAVTGLNQVISIVIIGVVCTFYSTIGGMKAVLVTDIFQSLLMFASVYSVIIYAGIEAGSLDEIWHIAQKGGRIYFTDISIDPTRRHTWWTQIIGGSATYLALYGVNQTQVQRLLSTRNLKASQKALWWNLPILMLLSFSTCFSGLCIYYHYKDCDPLLEGRIDSRDQLMPLFVVDTMGNMPGLPGLFVSGIFAASLSTISSTISSLSAVTLEDYLKPLYFYITKKEADDSKTALYSKLFSFTYGAICIGIAFLAGSLGGVLQAALSIFGIVGGPLLGLFTLGMYITWVNQKGAITGLALGLAISFWIGFGQPKPPVPTLGFSTDGCKITSTYLVDILKDPQALINEDAIREEDHYFYLYRISYMWYGVIGFLITFFCGLLASWIYSLLNWDSNAHVYSDTACTLIKYDLFVPPIARRLRCKQMPRVVVTGTSSEFECSRSSAVADNAEENFSNVELEIGDSPQESNEKNTNQTKISTDNNKGNETAFTIS